MKIAFASLYDLTDVSRGSGTYYSLCLALEAAGHQVMRFGPYNIAEPVITRCLKAFHRRIGKRYKTYLDPWVAAKRGCRVTSAIHNHVFDVFMTNDFGILGFAQTSVPRVIYTDVMLPRKFLHSPKSGRCGNLSIVGGYLFRYTIRRGLTRANLAVFPAEWAANEARKMVKENPRVVVVPFGANLRDPGPEIALKRSVRRMQKKESVEVLFIGSEWERKGGSVAVEAIRELNLAGVRAKLHIVGANTPRLDWGDFIEVHGLLDKRVESDRIKLERLFTEADLFLLPTASEGLNISILEAAAYGLPVLSHRVPGVEESVIDGVTGRLFELGCDAAAFSEAIRGLLCQGDRYSRLCAAGRRCFEEKYNWPACVRNLLNQVGELVAGCAKVGSDRTSRPSRRNGQIERAGVGKSS